MAPRETENNAYAKFLGDKQRALWYVMVFSGVVNKKQSKQSFGLVSCYALSLSEIQPLPSLKITHTPHSSLLE